jgi:hypothetical protein
MDAGQRLARDNLLGFISLIPAMIAYVLQILQEQFRL